MIDAADKIFAAFDNPTSKKKLSEIESSGAKIFKFTPLEFEKISADENLLTFEEDLAQFDWLIFPDVLAVDFFVQILEENETDLFELDALRICSFGEAVADQLRFSQLHTDVIPNKIETETILAAVKNYSGADSLADLRFLVPKEKTQQIGFVERLKSLRASVLELPVYEIKSVEKGEIARLKTLIAGGAIDEFVFTAPTDFINLKYFFGEQSLSEVFAEIRVSAVDAIIFQTLKEHDFKRAVLFHPPKIAKVNQ